MLYASCGGFSIFSTFTFVQTLWPNRKRSTYLTSIQKLMHHSIQVSNLMFSRILHYRCLRPQRNKKQPTSSKPPPFQQIPQSYFWKPYLKGRNKIKIYPSRIWPFSRWSVWPRVWRWSASSYHPPPFADDMFHSPFTVPPIIFSPNRNGVPPIQRKATICI